MKTLKRLRIASNISNSVAIVPVNFGGTAQLIGITYQMWASLNNSTKTLGAAGLQRTAPAAGVPYIGFNPNTDGDTQVISFCVLADTYSPNPTNNYWNFTNFRDPIGITIERNTTLYFYVTELYNCATVYCSAWLDYYL